MQSQKIRIRLKAFDYKLIDQSAIEIVETFLNTEFEGGRHERRVDKINKTIS